MLRRTHGKVSRKEQSRTKEKTPTETEKPSTQIPSVEDPTERLWTAGAKNAIISVYSKTGIVEFAKELISLGWNIISSGGTAQKLVENGVPVITTAQLRYGIFRRKMKEYGWEIMTRVGKTGKKLKRPQEIPLAEMFDQIFPTEMLGHRVATLWGEIHGGILATDDMKEELQALGYPKIGLVCIDLYPLEEQIKKDPDNLRGVLDKIDIGGPTMLMGAAKNLLLVASSPEDRETVLNILRRDESTSHGENVVERIQLAAKTFARIAQYRLLSAEYLSNGKLFGMVLEKDTEKLVLKYGENPNQKPAFFATEFGRKSTVDDELTIANCKLVQGTTPSFNNIVEHSRHLHTLHHLARNLLNYEIRMMGSKLCMALATKHCQPVGLGVSDEANDALQRMLVGDPEAIFGGVVTVTFPIGLLEAQTLLHYNSSSSRLLDGIFAPTFTPGAKELLQRKGENKLRLIENPHLANIFLEARPPLGQRIMQVRGGWLIQPHYNNWLDLKRTEDSERLFVKSFSVIDACIAQAVSHTSNSNTIAIAKNSMLLANASGQQSRVDAVRLVLEKAKRCNHELRGSVVSSDSFFPFPDGPELLCDAGVGLILTTSGSITGDPALRKLLVTRRKEGKPIPGVIMFPDETNRGFCYHAG